jgi:hypothetical protein
MPCGRPETKTCTDRQARDGDNNAWMAQLLMHGTSLVNFMEARKDSTQFRSLNTTIHRLCSAGDLHRLYIRMIRRSEWNGP